MSEIKLSNNKITATISTIGAELISTVSNDDGHEFIWTADQEFWGRHAPHLFPIVGRLKGDRYTYNGRTYFMPQHGFARDSEFEIKEESKDTVVFELKDSEDTLNIFPFRFIFQVKFTILNESIKTEYKVINPDLENDLFFSVGGHPGFNAEFGTDYLSIDPQQFYRRATLVPPLIDMNQNAAYDGTLPFRLNREIFSLDAVVLENNANKIALTLGPKNMKHGVMVSSSSVDFVGIWSPDKKNAPFIAIEPWWGIADTVDTTGELSKKFGIKKLEPKQEFNSSYFITFI